MNSKKVWYIETAEKMREMSRIWENADDDDKEDMDLIFSANYPFSQCFHEISNEVTSWAAEVSACFHDYKTRSKEPQQDFGIVIDMPEIIRMLQMEDYDLDIKYRCPEWNIEIIGVDDTYYLTNNPDGTATLTKEGLASASWSFTSDCAEIMFAEIQKLSI